MSVKISELPILDSLADNDVIAGVDTSANVTSKIEMATLKNYIDTNTQYTAGTNINITNNVISAPFVYDKTQTNALLDDFKDETNASIEDLKDEKDAQIEELQSEVDSLSTIFNAFPTESGEGESLTLDDTAEVKFKKFDLKGNTSQTQYTGANILDVEHSTVESLSGITSVTKGNNFINGTTSAIEWAGLQLVLTLEAGTYYYKHYTECSDTANSNGLGTFRVNKDNQSGAVIINQNVTTNVLNQINSATFTITEAGQYVFVYRYGNATAKVRNIIIKDIILSKTDSNYEPYVGKSASPNPSYPQPVNVVSGDNEINVVGKNLLNPNANIINVYFNSTTKQFQYNANNRSIVIPIKPNTTYTISRTEGYGNDFSIGTSVNYPTSGEYATNVSVKWSTSILTNTITSGANDKYLLFYFGYQTSESTSRGWLSKTQLEVGDQASTFEPYRGSTYNIDLPVENLWGGFSNSFTRTDLGVQFTANQDGTITANGTATNVATSILLNEATSNGIYKTLQKGTYTVSGGGAKYSVEVYDKNNVIKLGGIAVNESKVSFTINEETQIVLRIQVASGVTINETIKLQLEKSSKANSYTPYGTTPIELCKIGNYQDYFGKSDGRNLCNGINQGVYLNNDVNKCGVTSGDSGLYIPVNGGQYTISTLVTQTRYRVACSNDLPPSVSSAIAYNGQNKDNTSNSITINTTGYNYLIVNATNLSAIQIEKGSSASDYQPYGVGKWYLHKEIGKITDISNYPSDVAGQWSGGFDTNNYVGFYYHNTGIKSTPVRNDVLSNVFTPQSNSTWNGINGGIQSFANASELAISVLKADVESYAGASLNVNNYVNYTKDYINSLNPDIYIILANPTTEEITYQPLIDQLNELEKAMSKDGQTNISQVNNDKQFILDVTAIKSLQNILDRIELLES